MQTDAEDMPFRVTCETKAISRDAVVILGDKFYVQAGLLLAQQLFEKEGGSFDIVVLCSEDIEIPDELSKGLRIGRIVVCDRSLMPVNEVINIDAYVRIFLPYLLPEYRRICYMDADMYLHRPGIAALLEGNMQGFALAAVHDCWNWIAELRGKPYQLDPAEKLDAPEHYFNSGLLLIDCERYKAELPVDGIFSSLRENADHMPLHDQSFLNTHFSHRYLPLSPLYNFPMLDEYTPLVAKTDPIVLHFLGGQKPWYPTEDPWRKPYWLEYSEFLARHFGISGRENVHQAVYSRKSKPRNYTKLRRWLSQVNRSRKLKRARAFAESALAAQLEKNGRR